MSNAPSIEPYIIGELRTVLPFVHVAHLSFSFPTSAWTELLDWVDFGLQLEKDYSERNEGPMVRIRIRSLVARLRHIINMLKGQATAQTMNRNNGDLSGKSAEDLLQICLSLTGDIKQMAKHNVSGVLSKPEVDFLKVRNENQRKQIMAYMGFLDELDRSVNKLRDGLKST